MRPLAWCVGILAAALALYLLARGTDGPDEPVEPIELVHALDPADEARGTSATGSAFGAGPAETSAASPSERNDEIWQLLPMDELAALARDCWFVRGRLVDPVSGTGLGGVNLALEAHAGRVVHAMRQHVTDVEGNFELLVSRRDSGYGSVVNELDTWKYFGRRPWRRPISIVFEVMLFHYAPLRIPLHLNMESWGEADLGTIALHRGEFLRGRVVDTSREGVANAGVTLVACEGSRTVATAFTNASGLYALAIPEPGCHHVHARAIGRGANVLAEVEVPIGGEFDLPDMVLLAGGAVQGLVEYPDGQPAEGVTVLAIPESVAQARPSAAAPGLLLEKEREGGLFGGSGTTDHEGKWFVAALALGEYVPRFEDHPLREAGPPMPLGTSMTLVYPGHRLRVDVRGCDELDRATNASVECEALVELPDGTVERRTLNAAESRSSEAWFFCVEPGWTCEVYALLDDMLLGERTVSIDLAPYEQSIEFDVTTLDSEGAGSASPRSWPQPIQEGTPLFLELRWSEARGLVPPPRCIEAALMRFEEGRVPEAIRLDWRATSARQEREGLARWFGSVQS